MASSEMTSRGGLGPRASLPLDALLPRLPVLPMLPLGEELRGLALGEDGCPLWQGGGI